MDNRNDSSPTIEQSNVTQSSQSCDILSGNVKNTHKGKGAHDMLAWKELFYGKKKYLLIELLITLLIFMVLFLSGLAEGTFLGLLALAAAVRLQGRKT